MEALAPMEEAVHTLDLDDATDLWGSEHMIEGIIHIV